MNAATKMMIQESLFPETVREIRFTREHITVIGLALLVFVSAFAVVYTKAQERAYFSELQMMQRTYDKKQVEYGQLLLEQSSWSTPGRVQRIAQKKLGMQVPSASRVVIKKL